jgi:ribose transport system substrate-binding protein
VPPYELYERYREYAKTNAPYPAHPGRGKRLGYASVFSTLPFCVEVEQNILKNATLAGFHETDLIMLDNHYNCDIALKNADYMFSRKPHVFIEYQADVKVNNIVAAKFTEAQIPLLAVDIPVPGAPFVGVNNWQVATMGGKHMALLIQQKWGGMDAVDLVVLLQNPAGGETTMLRSEGFATTLIETFGPDAERKIVRINGGMGGPEEAEQAMSEVLASRRSARRIALTSINEESMQGAISALQASGRWMRDDLIVITLGVDDLGKQQIREGLSDAGVAFFPERYGEYLIPAACALLQGAPVPSHMYVENEIITRDNIERFYGHV